MWPDWAIFCTLGNNSKPVATIILTKLPTLLVNFCKGAKIIHFCSEIILGQLLWTFGNFYLVTLSITNGSHLPFINDTLSLVSAAQINRKIINFKGMSFHRFVDVDFLLMNRVPLDDPRTVVSEKMSALLAPYSAGQVLDGRRIIDQRSVEENCLVGGQNIVQRLVSLYKIKVVS